MFVSDWQTGHPPVLHIRMVTICYMDASPSAQLAFIPMIEETDAVQIVEIPNG